MGIYHFISNSILILLKCIYKYVRYKSIIYPLLLIKHKIKLPWHINTVQQQGVIESNWRFATKASSMPISPIATSEPLYDNNLERITVAAILDLLSATELVATAI